MSNHLLAAAFFLFWISLAVVLLNYQWREDNPEAEAPLVRRIWQFLACQGLGFGFAIYAAWFLLWVNK